MATKCQQFAKGVFPDVTKTLAEKDVFEPSLNILSLFVFIELSSLQLPTLLPKHWVANSLDIVVDFVLTVVRVFFNYAGQFFFNGRLGPLPVAGPERPFPREGEVKEDGQTQNSVRSRENGKR
ncbi:hypothetical protein DFH08DRAFT_971887 [Mycena albidolilacea]|uniref:Uncharacterized protein n=1 Tax=Mycena albidolilacea TaxID=1033008 RepID=A0AAD6ZCB1_9AGAR|nr:hypothetical protein DFH08DRAFT_971887 [Mycena albidolilacea]